jgi:hypothetical protein
MLRLLLLIESRQIPSKLARISISSALAMTGMLLHSQAKNRTEQTIQVGADRINVTRKLVTSDGIGDVCGVKLLFAGISVTNDRTFNCDGSGSYRNDSNPPRNEGNFVWGYVVSETDSSSIIIKSFKDWGYPYDITGRAAQIAIRFTSGSQEGQSSLEVIGVTGGNVLHMGDGGIYQSPR